MIETKETLQVMSMFMEMKYILSYLYMKNESLYFKFRNTYNLYFYKYVSIKCSIYLWSGKSQEKQSSLSMFVSLALFGKKSARSVARIQCLMFPNTSRYSSGLSFANMLWFSLIKKNLYYSAENWIVAGKIQHVQIFILSFLPVEVW